MGKLFQDATLDFFPENHAATYHMDKRCKPIIGGSWRNTSLCGSNLRESLRNFYGTNIRISHARNPGLALQILSNRVFPILY